MPESPDGNLIPITIRVQQYPIRTSLDPEYVVRLAAFVDEKMHAASESTPSGDSMRLAVLTALNIADELFRCRDAVDQRNGQLAERTGELERILDGLLMV
jgi:cell division protein ZapA